MLIVDLSADLDPASQRIQFSILESDEFVLQSLLIIKSKNVKWRQATVLSWSTVFRLHEN